MNNNLDQIPSSVLVVPFMVPILIAGIKRTVKQVPALWLPAMAPALGCLCYFTIAYFTKTPFIWWVGVLLGFAGVGLREFVWNTKKVLLAKSPTTPLPLPIILILSVLMIGCATTEKKAYTTLKLADEDVSKSMLYWEKQKNLGKSTAPIDLAVRNTYTKYEQATKSAKAAMAQYRQDKVFWRKSTAKEQLQYRLNIVAVTSMEVVRVVEIYFPDAKDSQQTKTNVVWKRPKLAPPPLHR